MTKEKSLCRGYRRAGYWFCIVSLVILITPPLRGQVSTHSVQVRTSGTKDYRPVPYYILNSGEGLEVEFDLIGNDAPLLCYSLSLHNADGSEAAMSPIEYIDGFYPADFDAPEQSRATVVQYMHYRLKLPNERLSPSKSGSYKLYIATTDRPSEPFLTIPFGVIDPKIQVNAHVRTDTKVDYKLEHQQVDIDLGLREISVYDPQREITIQVYRNGCTDDMQTLTKPSAMNAGRIMYQNEAGAVFEAGHEYHRFEALGTRSGGMGVSHTELLSTGYYRLYLYPNRARANLPYVYDADHNGMQVIRSTDIGAEYAATSADYNLIRFSLSGLNPLTIGDASLMLEGEAFRFLPEDQRRLSYSPDENAFVADVLLKQGYVEYAYRMQAGSKPIAPNLVDGNHYQTTNTYTIFVYHRGISDRYDRLVGACLIP